MFLITKQALKTLITVNTQISFETVLSTVADFEVSSPRVAVFYCQSEVRIRYPFEYNWSITTCDIKYGPQYVPIVLCIKRRVRAMFSVEKVTHRSHKSELHIPLLHNDCSYLNSVTHISVGLVDKEHCSSPVGPTSFFDSLSFRCDTFLHKRSKYCVD